MAPFDITSVTLPSRSSERFHANLAALRLLHDLEQSGRTATEAERLTLARFSAFGDSSNLNELVTFDHTARRYVVKPHYQAFLSQEQVAALRRSALTAFYTPLDVIGAIWEAVEQLGLNTLPQPRILEPSAGIGHFISAMPHDLRARAQITAVELDPVTARMLGHIHPDITLHGGIGFQQVPFRQGSFDLVISNVPFGPDKVHDPSLPAPLRQHIHDYFFAKAMQLVRPGGLVVFLTSWGTMDKTSDRMRSWLAEQAALLGAWRLPNGVFDSTSGSASAADLLILQKRPAPADPGLAWLDLAAVICPRSERGGNLTPGSCYYHGKGGEDLTQVPVRANRLWAEQPQRVIGSTRIIINAKKVYLQVNAPYETSTGQELRARMLASLPTGVISSDIPEIVETEPACQERTPRTRDTQIDLSAVAANQQPRAQGLLAIYEAAKALIQLEVEDAPALRLAIARAHLNAVYDTFVAEYGVIHHPSNLRLAQDAPELAFLQALEDQVQEHHGRSTLERWSAKKARIFSERTINARKTIEAGSLSAVDAVLTCLDEIGELRMGRVAALCGMTPDQVVSELGDMLFRLPGTHRYELADAYLSGDVKTKLEQARVWAETEPERYTRNVAALEAVQPAPLLPDDITVNPNAFWVPDEDMTAFIKHLLPAFRGRATYSQGRNEWLLIDTDNAGACSVEAKTKWGTPHADAIDILGAAMRGVSIVVYDTVMKNGHESRVMNPSATVAAQEKQEAIHTEFARWIWDDPTRSQRLCALYNERFNRTRLRVYDGKHLSFPGMARTMLRGGDLADYQRAAVWQVLQNPSTLIAFDVGGGKTFTAIASAIEAKRMGLVNKPLAVVPNNLVGQWAAEARRLYPGINVLAMAPEDFTKNRRGTVLSRIATGDWDLIIIGETSLKFLPLDSATLKAFVDRETDRLRSFLEELRATSKDSADQRSLKQIERSVMALEERLKEMESSIQRDSSRTIGWRELGIDMLIVDEAHNFKNLQIFTKMSRIAGLPTGKSQRALDMRIKTWDLLQRGGKVVFLTATPIMNTLGETYTNQLFLQEPQLEALGIHHFDEWVSLFAQPRMSFEMKPDGSGFRMTNRLDTFVNFVEMSDLWRQAMCVRTKAQMGLPEPKLVTGKVIPVRVPASPALKEIIAWLAERAEAIRGGSIDPAIDNMLRVVHHGRLAALDVRLLIPSLPRPRHSKIMELVKRVAKLYRTFDAVKATQIVFCDIATPKGKEDQERIKARSSTPADGDADEQELTAGVETQEEQHTRNFVYYEIRDELVKRGIPREEIAFIHDYNTKEQRLALFEAMNEGRMRVLIGSTSKMGVGMNVQRRLIALHDLDCPWRPGDLAQRHGRIIRQGNLFPEVYIFPYITEGSFDAYMWQAIESKSKFISKALAGEVSARTVKDTDEMVLTAAEVKAIASGNPLVMEKIKLDLELARLRQVQASWKDSRYQLAWQKQRTEEKIAKITAEIPRLEALHAYAQQHPHDAFKAVLQTQIGATTSIVFDKRADAGSHLLSLVAQYETAAELAKKPITATLGRYRGFDLRFVTHYFSGIQVQLIHPVTESLVNALTVKTDVGVWSSADTAIAALPSRITTLEQERTDQIAQLATIATEEERLAVWDGQATYDQVAARLAEIDATFAAQEAASQAAREAAQAAAQTTTAGTAGQETAEAASTTTPEVAPATTAAPNTPVQKVELSTELIAEVQKLLSAEAAEGSRSDDDVEIPTAFEALEWMRAWLASSATPTTSSEERAEEVAAPTTPTMETARAAAPAEERAEASAEEAQAAAVAEPAPEVSPVEALVAVEAAAESAEAAAPAEPVVPAAPASATPTQTTLWGRPAPRRTQRKAKDAEENPGQLTLWS